MPRRQRPADKREVRARSIVEGAAHFFEISSGRHDAVTGSQGGLGDSSADAATGTGDKPDFAHDSLLVGYESPAQFNREYRRMFGAPPRQHKLVMPTAA